MENQPPGGLAAFFTDVYNDNIIVKAVLFAAGEERNVKRKSSVRELCLCALMIALCVIMPISFHAVGLGGAFSPMHLPVLMCGLLCGPWYGLLCGILGPILSSLTTGMPGAPMLISMIPELAVYGLVTGLLMRVIRTGKPLADIYLSLIPAMVLGRIVGGIAKALVLLSSAKSYSVAVWASAYFAETLPGTILQLVLLPMLLLALMKAKAIPARYPKAKEVNP